VTIRYSERLYCQRNYIERVIGRLKTNRAVATATRSIRQQLPQRAIPRDCAGDSVTITLADEIDIARGDMLASARNRPQVADQFSAHLVWMSSEKLLPERSYLMKINHATVATTVTDLHHRLDINTLSKLAVKTLDLNEIGVCNMSVARPLPFDPYAENRLTGAFILIDRFSNETVAAGMIDFALRRATNIHIQNLTVSKGMRSNLMHHGPVVAWFAGLPGAGKSTIANLVEAGLNACGIHTIMSTATICAMGSTATSALPSWTGWRTSAALAKSLS
jgi:bifunctional enzyme CysN/CysC